MEYIEIKDLLKDLIPKLVKMTIDTMIQSGVDSNSDLINSIGYEGDDQSLNLLANDYWFYVSQGRRPRTRKVPIEALIQWIKDKGIRPKPGQSINQLAFVIQKSIYKQGINGKNYIERVIDAASDMTEEFLADEIIEELSDQIYDLMISSPYAK